MNDAKQQAEQSMLDGGERVSKGGKRDNPGLIATIVDRIAEGEWRI